MVSNGFKTSRPALALRSLVACKMRLLWSSLICACQVTVAWCSAHVFKASAGANCGMETQVEIAFSDRGYVVSPKWCFLAHRTEETAALNSLFSILQSVSLLSPIVGAKRATNFTTVKDALKRSVTNFTANFTAQFTQHPS